MNREFVPRAKHQKCTSLIEKRSLILSIHRSTTLSEEEKGRAIQKIMCPTYILDSGRQNEWSKLQRAEARMPTYTSKGGELGCRHYARACKSYAKCCGMYFTCRLCHDEISDHTLDRKGIEKIMCMRCGAEQEASAECASIQCKEANGSFAKYYCDICHLYRSDDKPAYHCDACGLCRLGDAEDFRHCEKCNVCVEKTNFVTHKCVQNSHLADCPVCKESMADCQSAVVIPTCGHPFHENCFFEYCKQGYKCPICSVSLGCMEEAFARLEQMIKEQPMPPSFSKTTAKILCNDCEQKSIQAFHFLGHMCGCKSYNTSILMIYGMPSFCDDE